MEETIVTDKTIFEDELYSEELEVEYVSGFIEGFNEGQAQAHKRCVEKIEELQQRDKQWIEALGKKDDYMDIIKNNKFLHRVDSDGIVHPRSPDIEMSVQKSIIIRNELRKEVLKKMKL